MPELIARITPDNKVEIQTTDGMDLVTLLQLTCSVQLQALKNATPARPHQDYEAVRDHLYDLYNFAVSQVLSMYAPDLELRPDLTTEAILRAEDEILRETDAETANRKNYGFPEPAPHRPDQDPYPKPHKVF